MFILRILPISILLIGLSFLIYQDKYVSHGYDKIYYEIYYYILVILIIFFLILILLIKSKSSLLKLYILAISSLAGLFLVEILLNYINLEKNYRIINIEHNNIDYDKRDKFTYYQDRKKKNPKITITIPTDKFYDKNYKILPLAGKSKSLSILCNETGRYVEYFSDRYGFNNNESNWSKKNKILLIGDSFTHGACVERKNTIYGRLNKTHNTINLGFISSGPIIEYARFKEFYKLLKTPYVVWIFSEQNDLDDLKLESSNNFLKKYLFDEEYTQNITQKQIEVDQIISKLIEVETQKEFKNQNQNQNQDKPEAVSLVKSYNLKFHNIRNKILHKIPTHEKYFFKIIKKVFESLKKNNAKLIFVYMPSYEKYAYDDPYEHRYNYIIDNIKNIGVEVIDMHKVFSKQKDVLSLYPFRQYGHPNEKGYKLVSDAIKKKISTLEKKTNDF
jgi:hypothetical protein